MEDKTEYKVAYISFTHDAALTLAQFHYYCDALEYAEHFARQESEDEDRDMVVFLLHKGVILHSIRVTGGKYNGR